MKTLTIAVDERYVETLDKVVRESSLYSSRSEFLKDAVREKLEALVRLNGELSDIRAATKKLSKKAVSKGWDGKLLTKKEKEKIASEFLKGKTK